MNDQDITEKTRSQLQTVFPPGPAEDILAQCWRVEDYPRVAPFCKALAQGG